MMKARSILILCLFLYVLVVDAQDSFTQGRFLYKVINDSVVELSETTYPAVNAYSPRNRTLVIPGYVQHEGRRYSVRSVSGFNYEPDLQHVMVEDGVESLIDAFSHCMQLKTITLGKDVECLSNAFLYLPQLECIAVDKSNVTYTATQDGKALVEKRGNCLVLGCKKAAIPSTIESINDFAFARQEDLEEMTIPEGVESIGQAAFWGCTNLRKINLPHSLKTIANEAFANCTSLTAIHIPQHVEDIGLEVFSGCLLLDTLTVDKGNKKYDSRQGCNALIETASDKLLAGCRSSFIPDGVREIGDGGFSSMSIAKVFIPKSVTKVGAYVFRNCCHLAEIKVDELNPVYDSRGDCNAIVETASHTMVAACMNTTFVPSIKAIGDYAFCGIPTPSVLNIPEGIKAIGWGAFFSNRYLERLILPKSVERIGAFAFGNCHLLREIRWKGYVPVIDQDVFSDCHSLWKIDIPEGTKRIRSGAFKGSSELRYVTLPQTLETIEQRAFEGCPVDSVLKATAESVGCLQKINP